MYLAKFPTFLALAVALPTSAATQVDGDKNFIEPIEDMKRISATLDTMGRMYLRTGLGEVTRREIESDTMYTDLSGKIPWLHPAPFSHAVEADGFVHITGQMPTDKDTDSEGLPKGIEAQTKNVMENLKLIIDDLGLSFGDVLYSRAFLQHFQGDYKKFNDIYASYFEEGNLPGRTCIGTTGLAQDALVEVDFIMSRDNSKTTYTDMSGKVPWLHPAPFSHAVESDDGWVYITGQMPTDEMTEMDGLPKGIEAQTKNVMENLKLIVEDLGLTLEKDVVYSRAFLQHFQGDYKKFNDIYASYFEEGNLPGRTCIGTTGLAQDALVEVDLVMRRPSK